MGKPAKKSKPKGRSTPQPNPIPKRTDLRQFRGEQLVKVRKAKQDAFLKFYGTYGTMALACHEIGIREERISHWRNADPIFDQRVSQAEKMVGDRLVKEVIKRAVEGEEKGIYNKQGELVDTVYEKSDTLLMFATKKHRPEYREKFEVPVIPAGQTNIQNNIILQIDPKKLPLDQLEAYERLLSSVPTPVHGSTAPGQAEGSPQGALKP